MRLLALTLSAAVLAVSLWTTALAETPTDVPTKQAPTQNAHVRLVVKPGEVARWRSPNIGSVKTLYVRINGRAASYNVVPHTGSCVAYIYGGGVAARITDCRLGRRVPYVRVRAISAALRPSVVKLRLN